MRRNFIQFDNVARGPKVTGQILKRAGRRRPPLSGGLALCGAGAHEGVSPTQDRTLHKPRLCKKNSKTAMK